MTLLLKANLMIEPILLLALLILAIAVFRANGSIAFLLLMLASICFFLWNFVPFAIGLFFQIRGWKRSGAVAAWMHSWWFLVSQTFYFLFLALMIAAFVFFIRERRRIGTPAA